jgi:hypothetical protein
MFSKVALGLVFAALFVVPVALLLRRRPAANGSAIGIGEIRQKLEAANANYKGNKAIDDALASLGAQYGDQIPAVAAIRFLREHTSASPLPDRESLPHTDTTKKTPDGVTIEWTPVGFLLSAANRSAIGGLVWLIFVGVLCAIPFVVFPDLLRSLFDAEGLSLWLGIAFLAAWTGGSLYTLATGAVTNFGGIRISRTGDDGEIFTGIGSIGRTHRAI